VKLKSVTCWQELRPFVFFASLLLVTSETISAQSPGSDAVAAWARSRIFRLTTFDPDAPLTDLQPFKPIVAQARVIALGEADHGIHEFLSFRNRFIRFAVQEMGVTAIAAETGYTESLAVDDYVNGVGELTPGVVGSVFSWSMGTPYSDNRALLEWMRAYNARPSTKRKIHFYGLDLTGGRAGRFTRARLGIDATLAYLATVDTAQSRLLRERLAPQMPRFTSASYDSLTELEQNALTTSIEDLVSLFERRQTTWPVRTSQEAYDRAYHQAIIARQMNANFRAARAESNPQAQRDIAMAENLQWVLHREGSQGRVLVFAANWHISKGPMWSDRFTTSLGENLHAMLGKDYVTIAATYFRGESGTTGSPSPFAAPESTSVALMMSRVGEPRAVLPLSNVPSTGTVADWFRTSRALERGRVDNMLVSQAFDAVVFIDTVHPAQSQ
jgi:erythromycin esterase